jgi:hypothetical protein
MRRGSISEMNGCDPVSSRPNIAPAVSDGGVYYAQGGFERLPLLRESCGVLVAADDLAGACVCASFSPGS